MRPSIHRASNWTRSEVCKYTTPSQSTTQCLQCLQPVVRKLIHVVAKQHRRAYQNVRVAWRVQWQIQRGRGSIRPCPTPLWVLTGPSKIWLPSLYCKKSDSYQNSTPECLGNIICENAWRKAKNVKSHVYLKNVKNVTVITCIVGLHVYRPWLLGLKTTLNHICCRLWNFTQL